MNAGDLGTRRLEIAPEGFGRPWYPLYVGMAAFDGDLDELSFHFIDAPHKGRVGLVRWWRALWR